MKRLLGLAGWAVVALGAGIAVFSLWALLDPAGAQLSDDANPFADPPSTGDLIVRLAGGLAIAASGLWLIARGEP
ncbi:hypothetical protein M2650_09700 [Luteimonas sp. SX5]|uniref:DUF3185 family protein n=1 Tax=Luteimonas galliterrae TaxID=2940486 RepID=A0ABT0MJ50_9GAMM|nr:hypothetical protein [Luteimonas galliterrae]MCL1634902.1 hypothetical protein [Luteimonas galliterrae]